MTMRWWGWGRDGAGSELPEGAQSMLRDAFGISGELKPPVAIEAVRLPDPVDGVRAALAAAVGDEHVRDDRETRIQHAVGRSYPDLVRIRSGDASSAPDAVAYPADHGDVAALLASCSDADFAVVPFGGGTSVVGGVEPLRGPHRAAVTLDLTRMRVVETDPVSLTAVLGPGHLGPEAEAALGEGGFTLGHFPQSFEFATVGGFVATRSAGQASTGYGRIDELVLGLRMACPTGELVAKPFPGTAAGPRLRELAVGSEGALGVITEATLRIRPLPEARRYEAWRFGSFAEGLEAYRAMEQHEASADICRLSDEAETALSLALAGSGEEIEPGGSLAILGFEGDAEDVEARRARAAGFLGGAGARPLGEGAGAAWERGRYRAPYLRDDLLDRAVMVETLETCTWWSNIDTLYTAVGDALRGALGQAVVMCHVSHLYPSGASLYFTFITAQRAEDPLGQWREAKTAACDAITSNGGTITHHHSVGRDHAPWMGAEVGETGLEVLRAAKDRLDPRGIMNPGKLIP